MSIIHQFAFRRPKPDKLIRVLLLVVVFTILAPAQPFPGKEWTKADKPESAGFSSRRLAALTGLLQTLDTSAMLVVAKGQVVYEYGDLAKLSYLASCRKSVLAMLYGNYVASGKIPLSKTLRELNMDDVGGLLPRELDATVENLITARSGVFHPASYPGDARDSAPPRGSQKPGTYYLYNNWDFNAAGAVFEKLTGRDIYDALETDLAQPIGMQDFNRSLPKKGGRCEGVYLSRLSHASLHVRYGAHRISDAARRKLEWPPASPEGLGS